jgi:hypothetical protein
LPNVISSPTPPDQLRQAQFLTTYNTKPAQLGPKGNPQPNSIFFLIIKDLIPSNSAPREVNPIPYHQQLARDPFTASKVEASPRGGQRSVAVHWADDLDRRAMTVSASFFKQ